MLKLLPCQIEFYGFPLKNRSKIGAMGPNLFIDIGKIFQMVHILGTVYTIF